MMRRKALLAASGEGGGMFPITLINGDNGEIGVRLFQYVIENAVDGSYTFREDEDVFLLGERVEAAGIMGPMISLLFSTPPAPNILMIYLNSAGVVNIVKD